VDELKPNQFTSYTLSPNDELQGSILTDLQRKVIQNLLADIAMEKLFLDYDPEHPLHFTQKEAHAKGQIEILTYILNNSVVANNTLNNPYHTPEV